MVNKFLVKNTILLAIFLIIPFIILAPLGNQVMAQGSGVVGSGGDESENTVETKLKNPLENARIGDIPTLIKRLLEVAITIGIPVIVLFIIYSGFLFVKAQGNPTELEKAKTTLKWVLVGAAILLGAWVLASAIQGTVDSIRQATVG